MCGQDNTPIKMMVPSSDLVNCTDAEHCVELYDAQCVVYNGPALSPIDTAPGDRLLVILQNISEAIANAGSGSSYIFNNGITNSSGTVGIGGALDQSTSVALNSNELQITDSNLSVIFDNGFIDFSAGSEFGENTQLYFHTDETHWSYTNSSNDIMSIDIGPGGIIISDAILNIGLSYIADYSTNWSLEGTPNAIPSVKWVLDNTGSYVFNNGLTNDGSGNVTLGGTLSRSTNIDSGTNLFNIYGEGGNITYSGITIGVSNDGMGDISVNTGMSTTFSDGSTAEISLLNEASVGIYTNDALGNQAGFQIAGSGVAAISVSQGMSYNGDNSSLWSLDTPNAIPSVAWILANVGGSYNFTSGITNDGSGNISLGGTLTQQAAIDISNYDLVLNGTSGTIQTLYDFGATELQIMLQDTGTNYNSGIFVSTTSINMASFDTIGNSSTSLSLDPDGGFLLNTIFQNYYCYVGITDYEGGVGATVPTLAMSLSNSVGSDVMSISLSVESSPNNGIIVEDSIYNLGMSYASDYSTSWSSATPNAIPSVAWVLANGGSYTFNNGLTNTSGTIGLGGILTNSTTIDVSNYGLFIEPEDTGTIIFGVSASEILMRSYDENSNIAQFLFSNNSFSLGSTSSGDVTACYFSAGADSNGGGIGFSIVQGGTLGITLNTDSTTGMTGIILEDSKYSVGAQYYADYSSAWSSSTPNAIPSVKWVLAQIAAAIA